MCLMSFTVMGQTMCLLDLTVTLGAYCDVTDNVSDGNSVFGKRVSDSKSADQSVL